MAALGMTVIVVGAVVLLRSGGDADRASAAPATASIATTTIRRQDLVETESEDGTLGYSDAREVVNHLSGTVTWVAAVGRVVRPDQALYRVDGRPVVLMNGRMPAYRALGSSSSASGRDVGQLEHGLRALGYDRSHDMNVDGAWDAGTTAAVQRWQTAHGLAQTGSIELGRVVFAPRSRRVASVNLTLGGAATGGGASGSAQAGNTSASAATASNTAMTTTSTKQVVTVDLDTTKSSLAKRAARVSVELPSGKVVKGRIASVGKVATKPSSSSGDDTSSSSSTATIELTITLRSGASALDQAPVTVKFEQSRVRNALTIPVTALLAQPGGRYAVQVVDGDRRRLVAVTPGTYASGYVQISGAELEPGMRVANAAVQ